jgi:prephenate dehydrogenase
VFTLFNCELVTTWDISIVGVWQIGESTNRVEKLKSFVKSFGETELTRRTRMRRSESKKKQQVEEQGGLRRRGRSRC